MKAQYQISGLILLILTFTACNKDVIDLATFASVLDSGGDFGSITYSETKEPTGETETQNGDEIWT